MADRDSYPVDVSDGDGLEDGYFNQRKTHENQITKQVAYSICEQGSSASSEISNGVFIISNCKTALDYANSTCFKKPSDDEGYVAFANNIDACDDASLDADIWTATNGTGGSSGETGATDDGYAFSKTDTTATGGPSSDITADDYTNTPAVDLKAGDCEVIVNVLIRVDPGNPTADYWGEGSIILTDGSNDVTLYTYKQTGDVDGGESFAFSTSDHRRTFRLVVDVTSEEVHVYEGVNDTSPTTVDVSGATGARWFLKFESSAKGNTPTANSIGEIRVYQLCIANATTGTPIYQTNAGTVSSASFQFSYLHGTDMPSTFNWSNAFDGSNYNTYATNSWLAISNAGTSLIHKAQVPSPTTFSVTSADTNITVATGVVTYYY